MPSSSTAISMRFSRAVIAALACIAAAVCFVGCSSGAPTPNIAPHLYASQDAAPTRAIDEFESAEMSALPSETLSAEQMRERMNELYSIVVYDRKRPVFADGDPAEAVYAAARAVLDEYVPSSWRNDTAGRFDIIHTVHDWLAYNTDYDFELYEEYKKGGGNTENSPAFHIDGVFLNGRAVCDGIARAFAFLCALDGIRCVRVSGSYSSAPHAWNKVELDGQWYNVDATADAAYYSDRGEYKKQLSHGFFMLSDDAIGGFAEAPHVFEYQYYKANADYDYYAAEAVTYTINGEEFSAVVKTAAQLNAIFSAIDASDRAVGKIELKLDFDDKSTVGNADAYTAEIAAAYSLIKNSDYNTSSSLPYFRYPNGVYLFLIYR